MTDGPTDHAPCPLPQTRVWRHGKLEAQGFPIDLVSDYLEDEDCVVWADLCHPDHAKLLVVAEELGLDPHAVEDAVSRHERPKFDRYPGSAFLAAYAVRLDEPTGKVEACRLSAFILQRALITVRSAHWFGPDRFTSRWDAEPELMRYGVPALLHAVLDEIVDGQFDALQVLDEGVEQVEEILFEDRPMPGEAQRQNFRMRKNLVELRRLILPMRDVVVSVHRWHGGPEGAPLAGVPAELEPYYQDLYDHVLRAAESTEALRDMVTTLFETSLSLQDIRLNNTMRNLSAWAAIIAVPTAITGYYGQNVPYPGFQKWSGYVSSTVLIVLMAGVLYVYFRRRKWL
ncbi:MAG TPA: magnesium transporter CorA family protein [Mycobacteriales bacterium]|nr:magnesium transporter CorA family protein [Mycobacteriales bacterium]